MVNRKNPDRRPAPAGRFICQGWERGTATIHAPVPDSPLDTPKQEIPTGSILRPGLRLYRVVAGARYETLQKNLVAKSVLLGGQDVVV